MHVGGQKLADDRYRNKVFCDIETLFAATNQQCAHLGNLSAHDAEQTFLFRSKTPEPELPVRATSPIIVLNSFTCGDNPWKTSRENEPLPPELR